MVVNPTPQHQINIADKVANYLVERAPPVEMRLQRLSQMTELYKKISDGERI